MTAVKIEGIDKHFGGFKALSNVHAEIKSGEFFTLLGHSGCGKTTLLRTIAGFNKQDKGQILMDGQPIDHIPAYKRDTGMVFQDYAVFPHMTTFENVAFGLKNRGVNGSELKSRVERALEMTRLGQLGDRTPDQLSGGQQQRVGLARAMVIEPKVLLMDEPLSNLDAKLRIEMREEIREMQKMLGITTIYVTHDQDEALAISDRIAVMHNGAILQTDSPWNIYKEPATKFVATFVGHMNIMQGKITASDKGTVPKVRIGKTLLKIPQTPDQESVLLAVRPEQVRPIFEKEKKDSKFNYLSGKVKKISFTGGIIQYVIECEGNFELTVEDHRPIKQSIDSIDKSLEVKFPIKEIMVFDPETGKRLC